MATHHQPAPHQRPIQQDWANREYIEVITCSIKKISDFLNSFGEPVCIMLVKLCWFITLDTALTIHIL